MLSACSGNTFACCRNERGVDIGTKGSFPRINIGWNRIIYFLSYLKGAYEAFSILHVRTGKSLLNGHGRHPIQAGFDPEASSNGSSEFGQYEARLGRRFLL